MSESARVVVANTGVSFDCPTDKAILDAALDSGLNLPHSCRGGACGTCKAEILEGEVDHGWVMSFAITDEEKAQGYCLTCQSKPLSDSLHLRMVNTMAAAGAADAAIAPAEFTAEVLAIEPVSPSVKRLVLGLPRGLAFRFRAGMNLEFVVPGLDQARPYSMANAPASSGQASDGQLVFYVTRHPEGRASTWLHTVPTVGDGLAVRGPYGVFAIPDGIGGPILALAGGTGLSPIISVVTDALARGDLSPIELWFSVRDRREVFALGDLAALARRHANFSYRVTLTRENAGAPWLHGRIPMLLDAEGHDLAGSLVLIAGAPGFVDDCSLAIRGHGAEPGRIIVDSFLPRGPAALSQDFG